MFHGQEFLHCPNFCLIGPFTFLFCKSTPYRFQCGPAVDLGHSAHSHKRFKQVRSYGAQVNSYDECLRNRVISRKI